MGIGKRIALCLACPGCAMLAAAPPRISPSQSPQLIPRTQQERDRQYRVEHHLVLTVHVSDRSGNPVTNLERGDFAFLDNQSPRALADFRSVPGDPAAPLAGLLVVLDTVNNTTHQLQSFEEAIEQFLGEQPPVLPHSVAIGVFSGSRVEAGDFTTDRDALRIEVRSRARRLHTTGCFEAAQWATAPRPPGLSGGQGIQGAPTEALECMNSRFVDSVAAVTALAAQYAGGESPLTVLWFGSGWPTLTNRQFRADTADLRRNFFTRLVEVTTALREAQMSLDALASPEDTSEPERPETRDAVFFAGVQDEGQVRAGDLGLHALAHLTGGRIFSASHNLARQIQTCAADLDAFYLLSFGAPPASGFGEYHAIQVNVDKPGVAVRTSALYYAAQ